MSARRWSGGPPDAGRIAVMLAALLVLGAAGCRDKVDGPGRMVWDRDTCRNCSMVISDRTFAAQVQAPDGKHHRFDDIGCALKWLDGQPYAADPRVKVWVTRQADGAWLDARAARYVAGQTTPMGFGHGATDADEGISFEALREVVRGSTARHHGGM